MVDLKLPKQRIVVNQTPPMKRVFSFLIDLGIIFFIILMPLMSPLFHSMTSDVADMSFAESFQYNQDLINNNASTASSINFMVYLLAFAYFVAFEYKLGQTPGKMIMNQFIVPTEGKDKPGLLRIMLRNLVVFFWMLWFIDGSYLFFTGRRLSDNFSRTAVVEEISI